MKILVFGANNQLGESYTRLLKQESRAYIAIRDDESSLYQGSTLKDLVRGSAPTQIVNLSLNPGLFRSEETIDKARAEQLTAACVVLAKAAKALRVPLIHHSSVAVFDGTNPKPYLETDACKAHNPLGKLARNLEKKTARYARHIILRTEGIFGPGSSAFFKDCINLCKEQKGKLVLLDQRCSPTPVGDVARVIQALNKQLDCDAETWGVFHYCALQATHRHTFVEKFLQEAARLDNELTLHMEQLEISTQQSSKTQLENSVVDCQKIMASFGIHQRSRGEAFKELIASIYA